VQNACALDFLNGRRIVGVTNTIAALSSAVNSSCKDLAWEASGPSGVTGRGKNLGKKKAAPDDDRRQTTEDDRRRRVVFGNVAFDIIQV